MNHHYFQSDTNREAAHVLVSHCAILFLPGCVKDV